MAKPHASRLSKNLRARLQISLREKHEAVFDHIWRCIELGQTPPLVRIFWCRKKNDIEVQLISEAVADGPVKLVIGTT